MKKSFLRIVIIFLLAMICMSLFAGCKKPLPVDNKYNPDAGIDKSGNLTDIVSAGVSAYKIVIPEGDFPCEQFAAKELSDFIFESTGARLETVTDSSAPESKFISLGKTTKLNSAISDYDYTKLNLDGFFIKTKSENIFICGSRDRGTLYGVYDFLEKCVGVRFVSIDYNYVPKNLDLKVYPMDIMEVPAFEVRAFWNADTQADALYSARMRTGGMWNPSSAEYGFGIYRDFYIDGHNALHLTAADTNFPLHPECYSEINGKRQKLDICWTNGIKDDGSVDESLEVSTVNLLVAGLKKRIISDPDVKYYFLGQEDSIANICACSRCSAIRQKYGNVSAGIVRMLNAVSSQLQKWSDAEFNGKHIKLAAYAYTFSEKPPVNVSTSDSKQTIEYSKLDDQIVPNEHVYIMVTPASNGNHAYSYADPRQREFNVSMFGGWKYLTDNLMVYDYLANFDNFIWYHPNMSILKDNLVYFDKIGADVLIYQSDTNSTASYSSYQAYLKTYIHSRLMWNPNRDVRAITEEFCNLYYGKYGKTVIEFIDSMENHLAHIRTEYGADFYTHMSSSGNLFDPKFYPLALLAREEQRLAGAMEELQNDSTLTPEQKAAYRKRLASVIVTPQMMILTNYSTYYGNSGLLDYAKKFFANCDLAGMEYYRESGTIQNLKDAYGV